MAPRLNLVPVERPPAGTDAISRRSTATLVTGAKPGGHSSQLVKGLEPANPKKVSIHERLTGAVKKGAKANTLGKKKRSLPGQPNNLAGSKQSPASSRQKLTPASHNCVRTSIEKKGCTFPAHGVAGAGPALQDVTGRVQQHSSASAPASSKICALRRPCGQDSPSIARILSQQRASLTAAAMSHSELHPHPTHMTAGIGTSSATEHTGTFVQPTGHTVQLTGASKVKSLSQSPRPPRAPLSISNPARQANPSSVQAVLPPAFAPPTQPIQVSPVAVPPSRIGRLSARPRAAPPNSTCKSSDMNSTPKSSSAPAKPVEPKQLSAATEAVPARIIRLPSLSGFSKQRNVAPSCNAPGTHDASGTGGDASTTLPSEPEAPEVSEEALRALGFAPCRQRKQPVEGADHTVGNHVNPAGAVRMSAPGNTTGQPQGRRSFSSAARRFLEMPEEERQCFIEQMKCSAKPIAGLNQAGGSKRRHSAPIQTSAMVPDSGPWQPTVESGTVPTHASESLRYRSQTSAPGGPVGGGPCAFGLEMCSPEVVPQASMRNPITPPSVIIHAQAADPSEYGGDDLNACDFNAEHGDDDENAQDAWPAEEDVGVQDNRCDLGNDQACDTYHDWAPEWEEEEEEYASDQQHENEMQEHVPWERARAMETHDSDTGHASAADRSAQEAMHAAVTGQPFSVNQPLTCCAGHAHANPVAGHAAPAPARCCGPVDDLDAELRMAEDYANCEDDGYEDYLQNEAAYAGADASCGMPVASHLPPTQPYHAPPSHADGAQVMAQPQAYPSVGFALYYPGPTTEPHMNAAPAGTRPIAGDKREVNVMSTAQAPMQSGSHALPPAGFMQKRVEQQKHMQNNAHQHTHAPAHRDNGAPAAHGAEAVSAQNARQNSSAFSAGHVAAPQAPAVNAFAALKQGQQNLQGAKQGLVSKNSQFAALHTAHTASTSRAPGQVGSARAQVREMLPNAPLIPRSVLRAYDARSTVPPVYQQTGPPPDGLGKTGQPWWTVMQDFIPYALVKFAEIPASELAETNNAKTASRSTRAADVNSERTASVLGIGGGAFTSAAADGKRKSRASSSTAKSSGGGNSKAGTASKKSTKKRKTKDLADLEDTTNGNVAAGPSRNVLYDDDDDFSEGRPRTGTAKSAAPSRGEAMVEKSLAVRKSKKSLFAHLGAGAK